MEIGDENFSVSDFHVQSTVLPVHLISSVRIISMSHTFLNEDTFVNQLRAAVLQQHLDR
jgi:hypothetical protein